MNELILPPTPDLRRTVIRSVNEAEALHAQVLNALRFQTVEPDPLSEKALNVIEQINRVMADAQDAETGQRGFLLTRKPEFTHEQFVKHWFEIHGPLAHAVPGVARYVQSHIVGTRTRPDIPETDVDVDGIAELWYEDQAALTRAAASPEMKRLTDDGALFIGRIKTFIVEERQIIPA